MHRMNGSHLVRAFLKAFLPASFLTPRHAIPACLALPAIDQLRLAARGYRADVIIARKVRRPGHDVKKGLAFLQFPSAFGAGHVSANSKAAITWRKFIETSLRDVGEVKQFMDSFQKSLP